MSDLYAALQPVLDEQQEPDQEEEQSQEDKQRAVQLAIMGLPNVVCLPLKETCAACHAGNREMDASAPVA